MAPDPILLPSALLFLSPSFSFRPGVDEKEGPGQTTDTFSVAQMLEGLRGQAKDTLFKGKSSVNLCRSFIKVNIPVFVKTQ